MKFITYDQFMELRDITYIYGTQSTLSPQKLSKFRQSVILSVDNNRYTLETDKLTSKQICNILIMLEKNYLDKKWYKDICIYFETLYDILKIGIKLTN